MLTPQNLQEKTFERAVFGGYDMGQVDDFLDEVSADYAALYKENMTLKSKMKVVVDRIEEYRAVDGEMRKALFAAQTAAKESVSKAEVQAKEMLDDARKQADEIIAEANIKAEAAFHASREEDEKKLNDLRMRIAAEEKRLAEIMAACDRYNNETKATLNAILSLIDGMPAPVSMPAAPAPEPVVSIPEPEPQPVYSVPEVKIPDPLPPLGDEFKIEIPDDLGIPAPDKLPEMHEADKGVSHSRGTDDMRTTFYTVDFKEGKPLVRESDAETNEGFTPKPRFDFSDLRFGKNKDKGKN